MTEAVLKGILNAIPYPVVFVDTDHIIRYMNMKAEYVYYKERGFAGLIGKSLFDCHSRESRQQIEAMVERFRHDKKEVFLKVNARNERVYVTPVKDETGTLIGYFERYEGNFAK